MVEQIGPVRVERVEGLVEQQQLGLVEQRAAKREPLRHPAGEGADPLVANPPEAESLQEHPAPLATLLNAVEATVEVEVLERRQLAVDERLVGEEADRASPHLYVELTPPSVRAARHRVAAGWSCRSRSDPSRA